MGTGSTAVVCKKLKRKFIGSEISKEYMKVINERLKGVTETLF
jgi:site-specific DNA-methyltransferase (adenine-specific)/modification methylase